MTQLGSGLAVHFVPFAGREPLQRWRERKLTDKCQSTTAIYSFQQLRQYTFSNPFFNLTPEALNCITILANLHKCMLRIESKYRSQEILQEDASSIEQKSPLRQIVSKACAGWSKYNRCWENPPIRAGITEFSINNVRIVALKSVAVRQHCQPLNY